MGVPWLKTLVAQEIQRTAAQTTLLRGNLFVTKLLLAFMRVSCGDVLFVQMREVVEEAVTSFEKYEVDPKKVSEECTVDENIENLIHLTKSFLRTISESINYLPIPL